MTDSVHFVPLLAAMDTRSLQAIIATTDQMPGIIPTLQAWLGHCFRREHRRDVTRVLAFFEGLPRALAAEQECPGSALH